MTIEQVIAELRRPFPPEAVGQKIQSTKGKKALIVNFIDARQAGERLNLIVPDLWGDNYKPIEVGGQWGVECEIQIRTDTLLIGRADVGIMEGGFGGLKAVYSDAFKRAAVKWGIGVSLYASPRFYADKGDLDKSGENYYLSRKVEQAARENYRTWLKNEGIARFGQPLDLGDKLEDQGDIEVANGSPDISAEVNGEDNGTITEEEAAKLRAYFRAATEALPKAEAEKLSSQVVLWLNSQGADSLEDLTYEQAEHLHQYISGEAEAHDG